jgi:release factor glutamine methyltransferase
VTLADVVSRAGATLGTAGLSPETGRREAELLARHVLGCDLASWLVRQRDPASTAFKAAFAPLVQRRAKHEPIAYITGTREFFGRPFAVTPAVLIPRPETELVVEEAVADLASRPVPVDRRWRIADIGTGSGCLAITLALEHPRASIVATDTSAAALRSAASSARRLKTAHRIEFRHTSLLDGVRGPFDLIVSNPPYVAERDRASLPADVRDYEPATALFGGEDGLDVLRALIPAAERALVPRGTLVVEIGADQADAAAGLLGHTSFDLVRLRRDLADRPRVVIARRGAGSV